MAKELRWQGALRLPARRVAENCGECASGALYSRVLQRAGERRALVNTFVWLATETDAETKSAAQVYSGELRWRA
jgi:hypothetical protein